MEQGTGVDLHFAVGKIKVAASLRTGVSNSPPDCCIQVGSIPVFLFLKQETTPVGWFSCLEQGTGVEPAQSAWEAEILPIN